MARTPEHVIETQSRRIVTSLLPAGRFVERDQTERDYGIDRVVECFDDGEPSGLYLLLQIKGTAGALPDENSATVPYDIGVKHLLRAERFVVPCLLAWCPVEAKPSRFWYVWLQEYVRVVLDPDYPRWRQQQTVRVHIPSGNMVSDEEPVQLSKLRHIANHPRRLEQFGQLARLTHEARFALDDPSKLRALFKQALELDAIYGDPNWRWSQIQRLVIERGLLACEISIAGIDPTAQQLREIGFVLSEGAEEVEAPLSVTEFTLDRRCELLAHAAANCASLLSNAVAVYFDYRLHNTVWKTLNKHQF